MRIHLWSLDVHKVSLPDAPILIQASHMEFSVVAILNLSITIANLHNIFISPRLLQ